MHLTLGGICSRGLPMAMHPIVRDHDSAFITLVSYVMVSTRVSPARVRECPPPPRYERSSGGRARDRESTGTGVRCSCWPRQTSRKSLSASLPNFRPGTRRAHEALRSTTCRRARCDYVSCAAANGSTPRITHRTTCCSDPPVARYGALKLATWLASRCSIQAPHRRILPPARPSSRNAPEGPGKDGCTQNTGHSLTNSSEDGWLAESSRTCPLDVSCSCMRMHAARPSCMRHQASDV